MAGTSPQFQRGKEAESRSTSPGLSRRSGSKGQPPATGWQLGKLEGAVMRPVVVVALLVTLDATILTPISSQLTSEFRGTAPDAFWFGAVFLLAATVIQPVIAALSPVFGAKQMLLVSIAIFLLGTWVTAPIAQSFPALLVGRSIQGLGTGGILAMNMVVLSGPVTLKIPQKYFLTLIGVWAFGNILSPLLGGLYVEHLSWRWCFYVNFLFCGVGFLLIPALVQFDSTPKSSLASRFRQVDGLGMLFVTVGLASLIVGLIWGSQYRWPAVITSVFVIFGVLILGIGIAWEKLGATEAFLPLAVFGSLSSIAGYLCTFIQGIVLICALVYFPYFLSAVLFLSPVQACGGLLFMLVPVLIGTVLVSVLFLRLGRFRWALWIGWTATVAGSGFLLLLDQNTSTALWITVFSVFGLGNGMVLTGLNVTLATLNPENRAPALVMNGYVRTIGMTLGIVFADVVFRAALRAGLANASQPTNIADAAESFAHELAVLDTADPARVDAVSAYVYGFRGLFWFVTAAAVLSLLASFAVRNPNGPDSKGSSGLRKLRLARGRQHDVPEDVEKRVSVQSWEALGENSDIVRTVSPSKKQRSPHHGSGNEGGPNQGLGRWPANGWTTTQPSRTPSPAQAFLVLPGGHRVPVDIQYESQLGLPRRPPSVRLDENQAVTPKEWL